MQWCRQLCAHLDQCTLHLYFASSIDWIQFNVLVMTYSIKPSVTRGQLFEELPPQSHHPIPLWAEERACWCPQREESFLLQHLVSGSSLPLRIGWPQPHWPCQRARKDHFGIWPGNPVKVVLSLQSGCTAREICDAALQIMFFSWF